MITARTKNGTQVIISFERDVEPNAGGYYCEVELQVPPYIDFFCIHPEDCDCTNLDEVEEFARKIVSEIVEY